jgi:hypothetical protein
MKKKCKELMKDVVSEQLGAACSWPPKKVLSMYKTAVNPKNHYHTIKGADIIDLQACHLLTDVGCLGGLEQMQELNISGCESLDADSICAVIATSAALSKLIFGSMKVRPLGNLQRSKPQLSPSTPV